MLSSLTHISRNTNGNNWTRTFVHGLRSAHSFIHHSVLPSSSFSSRALQQQHITESPDFVIDDTDEAPTSKFSLFVESKTASSGVMEALRGIKLPKKGKFQRRVNQSALEEQLNTLLQPWLGFVDNYQACVILKQIQNPSVALKFFDWVKAQRNFAPNVSVYAELIKCLGRTKWFAEMEFAFLRMQETGLNPTAEIYCDMIDAYLSSDMIVKSISIYDKMIHAGFLPDISSYRSLVDACCKQGMLREALKLYTEMIAFGIKPDTEFCMTVLEICAALKEVEKASTVFRYMQDCGLEVNADTYNFMMYMHVVYKNIDSATMLFEEMIKKEIPPDITTYCVLMGAYKSRRMKREARKMVTALRERGVLGEVDSHNEQIQGFVRADKLENALKVFEKMEETNVLPNGSTYSHLIRGCVKRDKFLDAKHLVNTMHKELLLPCLNAYSLVLQELIRSEHHERSVQIWSVMEKLRQPVHKLLSLLSYANMREESWKWAEIYLDELRNEEYNDQLLFSNLLLEYAVKTVSRRCALRLYGELRKRGVYSSSFEKTLTSWTLNFHDIPPTVGLLALRYEFARLHNLAEQNVLFPKSVFVFIGLGWKSHLKIRYNDLRYNVVGWLEDMASPFDFLHGSEGKMHAKGYKVKDWLLKSFVTQVLDFVEESYFVPHMPNLSSAISK